MRADGVAQCLRQAADEPALQVAIGIEQREGAFFARQRDRGRIRRVAQFGRDARRHGAALVGVVAQAQHRQRAAQAQEAQPDAALGARLGRLLRQRPLGGVQYQVEHAHRDAGHLAQARKIDPGIRREWRVDESGQVERAQVAAAIRWQRLLAAGIGGAQLFGIPQVVLGIHAIDEQHARLGVAIGRAHDAFPQCAGAQFAIDPQAVFPAIAAGGEVFIAWFGRMHQRERFIGLDGAHEGIRYADRDIEVGEPARVLGRDEALDVRMADVQHTHLGAAPGAGRFDRAA